MPAIRPASSRTGEYENVNQVLLGVALRFITRGRSSR
jgi:hypothetical protein